MVKLSAEEMLNKFSKSSSHPHEVCRLGLMIFDEVCAKLFEMPNAHRKYLEAACLLHDIGYYIESKGHNKHSLKMIIEHGLLGFTERETMLVACICRYHRGSLPDKEEHEIYNLLDKKERKIVKRLAGILKISDGLDRGHMNLIKEIKLLVDKDNDIVEFILTPKTVDYHPDIAAAVRKRDLFEIGFKCQCVLKFSA